MECSMDWPCNLNDWRLYYRDNALAAIIPSIQQPPAHQPHQTNPPIVGNRLQRHRGTHVYVLAGGLALAGFILGFTHRVLDVPPKLFHTQSRENHGGAETRHGASLHTWRGWRLWWGNGDSPSLNIRNGVCVSATWRRSGAERWIQRR